VLLRIASSKPPDKKGSQTVAMAWLEGLGASPTGLVYVFGPVLAVTYLLALATWRLYLCPQAEIPGPTLAKLTYW